MADAIFSSILPDLWNANVDYANDTLRVALVTSSYTFSAAHDFFDDITNEVSGTGYTAGGETLSITITNGKLDATNSTWTSATFTARGAVVYKDTGNSATSNLIAFYDFTTDKSPSNGTLTLAWNASGLITLAAA